MALQGNPFLGKLKVPAPDLSRIPKTPFDSKEPKTSASSEELGVENQEKPNRVQTGSIGFSNRVQTGSGNGANRVQTKIITKPAYGLNPIEPVSIRVQTGSETGSNGTSRPLPLGELSVLRFIADSEPSPGIPVQIRRRDAAVATAQTLEGVKTALKRLLRGNLVELISFQRGAKNGFTVYKITDAARSVLASKSAIHSLGFKRVQTGSETGSIGFFSSSSSVLEENIKTTTSEVELFENTQTKLAPEWQQVDISPLSKFGFTQTHLIQIIRQGKLSPSEVQDSINFYAFDLTRNGLKPNSQLNFFMGIVRKGMPYAPPENYESPADEARRKTREFKERKVREREEELKQLRDLDFKEWRQELSLKEILTIVPEFAERPGQVQESYLKKHHEEVLWPERSAKLDETRAAIQLQIEDSLAGEGRG